MIVKLTSNTPCFETEIKKWKCIRPDDLFALEITGIQKNEKNEETCRSTYQFFMTQDQLNELAKVLVK